MSDHVLKVGADADVSLYAGTNNKMTASDTRYPYIIVSYLFESPGNVRAWQWLSVRDFYKSLCGDALRVSSKQIQQI